MSKTTETLLRLKAKFHYASWFDPDSVMEFGFKQTVIDKGILIQLTITLV